MYQGSNRVRWENFRLGGKSEAVERERERGRVGQHDSEKGSGNLLECPKPESSPGKSYNVSTVNWP